MRRILVLLLLMPASLSADDHIQIGVQCEADTPVAVAVRMGRADQVLIGLLPVFRYCEHRAAQAR